MDKIETYDEKNIGLPEYEELNEKFNQALQVVDDIVLKNYITNLKELEIVPLNKEEIEDNISENVRFFKVNEMVYEKDEYATNKFASVYNTLVGMNCTVFIMINSNGEKTDFYMGIRANNSDRTTSSLKDTLKNSLEGQFPGIKTKDYFDSEMKEVLKSVKGTSIASVSSVANSKDDNKENKSFIQGLEKFALSMQGQKYTGIIMANGTSMNQIAEIRKSYENIYTQLSPFGTSQISYGINKSINLSKATTESSTKGKSYGDSSSFSESKTNSTSESISNSTSQEGKLSRAVKMVSTASGVLGAVLTIPTAGLSLVASTAIEMLGPGLQKTETETKGKSNSTSEGTSATRSSSFNSSENKTSGSTDTEGTTHGNTQTKTVTMQNKTIIEILKRIDVQLERLKEFESLGMWECAAYFLSDNQYGAEIAASTYKALMRGEKSGVEVSAVNFWNMNDGYKTEEIKKYVTNFIHPNFNYNKNIEVTPCSLVSGNELAIHMGLPRKSVSGFPVIEHADFAKEVVNYSKEEIKSIINLGNIFNMGKESNNRVRLDRNSLSMHTFITGSTGAGKSNTVYEMLNQLDNVDIKFLIIEPAKGEYKNIFGHEKNVTVLGTNPIYHKLLKINPFKFPKKVHVLEHVDRLIEIFNVCWPMYAAMPAVLKDAVLKAYREAGWNLEESINMYSENLFPTFKDLQTELVNVIQDSEYSEELKSNYIGSLVTRIKSLTNGLNGQIFSANETDNKILFDDNTIVDLSRVGSLETKSLIMGILIMRLSEHRMTYAEGMNMPLKHVTVLEEAHNILKRVSTEQNGEGSNVAGKSVEMISNAIAEMRTYGEGFIIADQSPSAVDISAIRNTNTKIIMRLPDEADRYAVGKAAALSEEQINEIAKLPKGVAVVYQNEWVEPVLCKINKFKGEEKIYDVAYEKKLVDTTKKGTTLLLNFVMKNRLDIPNEFKEIDLLDAIEACSCNISTKIKLYSLVKEYVQNNKLNIWNNEKFGKQASLVKEILNLENIIISSRKKNIELIELNCYLNSAIAQKIENATDNILLGVNHCLMKAYSEESLENLEYYQEWYEEVSRRGSLI